MNVIRGAVIVGAVGFAGVGCSGSSEDAGTDTTPAPVMTSAPGDADTSAGSVAATTSVPAAGTGTSTLEECRDNESGDRQWVDFDGDGTGECVGVAAPLENNPIGPMSEMTIEPGVIEVTVRASLLGEPTDALPGLTDLRALGAQLELWNAADALQFQSAANHVSGDGACSSTFNGEIVTVVCATDRVTSATVVEIIGA